MDSQNGIEFSRLLDIQKRYNLRPGDIDGLDAAIRKEEAAGVDLSTPGPDDTDDEKFLINPNSDFMLRLLELQRTGGDEKQIRQLLQESAKQYSQELAVRHLIETKSYVFDPAFDFLEIMPRIEAARDHEGVPIHDLEALHDFIIEFRLYLVRNSVFWEPAELVEAIADALVTKDTPPAARLHLVELVMDCYQEEEEAADAMAERNRQQRHRWKRRR